MLTNPFLHWIDRLYSFLVKIGSNLQSLFILYMRLHWGHKLFLLGTASLQSIDRVAALLTSVKISSPLFHAYELGIVEAVCGFLLMIGLISRLASLALLVVMVTALSDVHPPELSALDYLLAQMKIVLQESYPYLITAAIVFVFGPGRVSIDGWIRRWVENQPRY